MNDEMIDGLLKPLFEIWFVPFRALLFRVGPGVGEMK